MSHRMFDTAYKTYKTRENAIKAIEKKLGHVNWEDLRYVIVVTEDGRYLPCLIGSQAIQYAIGAEVAVIA